MASAVSISQLHRFVAPYSLICVIEYCGRFHISFYGDLTEILSLPPYVCNDATKLKARFLPVQYLLFIMQVVVSESEVHRLLLFF